MLKKRGKKAQITIFIILGILILFGTASYIYVKTRVMREEITIPEILVPTVPSEIQPIKTYIEDCVESTAKNALKKAGEYGGYTDLSSFAGPKIFPTESNAVEYMPNSGINIPYWWYMESENECQSDCKFESMILPLTGDDSVEEQLSNYIDLNLKKCLLGFYPFKEEAFEIEELGDVRSVVTIREAEVAVHVRYPIEVTLGGKKSKLRDSYVRIPSSIKEMYEAGVDIVNKEIENCFIEDQMMNMINLYGGTSRDDLPPTFALTMNEQRTTWIKFDVEKKLKKVTKATMDQLKFYNSIGFPYIKVDESVSYATTQQAIYDQLTVYPFENYRYVDVSFHTPLGDWKPYFDIQPSQGQVIIPEETGLAGSIPFFSSIWNKVMPRTYEFVYMYSFPIIVELGAPTEEGGEEILRFAIEGNIRSNTCFKQDAEIVTGVRGIAAPSLCDLSQRTGENITLTFEDKYNRSKKLDETAVYYYAGTTCLLGYSGENGSITFQLPPAYGGVLNFKKDKYIDKFLRQENLSDSMIIQMEPMKTMGVSFAILNEHAYDELHAKPAYQRYLLRDSYLTAPTENDTIILQLTRIPKNYEEGEFTQAVTLDKGELTPETVDLAAGTYTITATLISNQNITIPEERDWVCAGEDCDKITHEPPQLCGPDCLVLASGCSGDECDADEAMILPKMNFTSIPNGGVEITEDFPWVLEYEDELEKAENVTFYLYRQPIPTRQSHLNQMSQYKDWSSLISNNIILPEVK